MLLFTPLSILPLIYHESSGGLLFGLLVLCLLGIPLGAHWTSRRKLAIRVRLAPLVALISASIVLAAGLCAVSPPGTAESEIGRASCRERV